MTEGFDTRDAAQYPAIRRQLAADPYRPRYHFVAPANWLNDPNGCIQWQGTYHLFYQHNVAGPLWSDIHWGHATSTDLVHWRDHAIALAPTPDSPDADGCWSGCAVDNDGVPTLIYSGNTIGADGTRRQQTCIATSNDGLQTWEKHPANPVIAGPPPGMETVQYRDPSVWREDATWYCVTGSGIVGIGGTALLYRSADLVHWDYMHPLLTGDVGSHDPLWTGPMWECPQFFPLGNKHVLLISVWDSGTKYVAHYVGTYANHRFTPESLAYTDVGGSFYAPQSLQDDRGRRIMWGWLRERRDRDAQQAAGWSGVMSLPRVLSLLPDNTVGVAPAPELMMLRGAYTEIVNHDLASGEAILDVYGDCLEIRAVFAPGDAQTCGLVVRRSPDGAEETRIIYEAATQRLTVDRTRSNATARSDDPITGGVVALTGDELLVLRIFLDGSTIEIFANERLCLAERIYASRADSLGIAAFATGGTATLRQFEAWNMASIWE